ncbi:MAG: hypothetical protein QOG85_567 [Gaiellaceae bacterium]|nr:hypothetical protein [Gaiellaceae bacterium]
MPGVEELRAQLAYTKVIEDRTDTWHVALWVPDEAPPARRVLSLYPIRAIAKESAEHDADVWMDGWLVPGRHKGLVVRPTA